MDTGYDCLDCHEPALLRVDGRELCKDCFMVLLEKTEPMPKTNVVNFTLYRGLTLAIREIESILADWKRRGIIT